MEYIKSKLSSPPTAEELASRTYVRCDTPGVEVIPPNEAEDIQAVADMVNTMQRAQFNKGCHCFGGTHARTQGVVKGKFIVLDDLPNHLKQSELFEQAKVYDIACRYSSEPGDPGLDDRIQAPRGFAMKIFGVNGEMFPDGQGIPTHDFEFNSAPAIELADAKTTREIFELRMKYGGDKKELYKHYEKRDDADLQKARDQIPNKPLQSHEQYGQGAYRFGDYVMKYRLIPNSDTQEKDSSQTVKPDLKDGETILHAWLSNFHRNHEAAYLFQVQLSENLDDQSVEYAGTP